jgi:BED zinc finger
MSSNKKSAVWSYFTKSIHNNIVSCTKCSQTFKNLQGNTSTLHRHLFNKHQINTHSDEEQPQSKKIKLIDNFVVKCSLEETVAKLASLDGISIRGFVRSAFIRSSFSLRGMKLPQDETAVMLLIHKFYEQVKEEQKLAIKNDLIKLKKFSLSLDEWTSSSNRR